MDHSMRARGADRWVGWLALLIVVASALHFLGGQVADPDLWQHLRYGEMILEEGSLQHHDTFSYTAPGAPVVNHEWLAQVLIARTFGLGASAGLVLLKLVISALLLVLLADNARTLAQELTGRRSVRPLTLAAGLVLALAVIGPGATFRPQLFTILLLALQGALLARADERLARPGLSPMRAVGLELWVQPLLLAFWANLHGGFVVGVAQLGLFVTLVLVRTAAPPRFRGTAIPPARATALTVAAIGLLGLAAPLLNPYGVGLYEFLFRTLHVHDEISEWHPIAIFSGEFLRFKGLVLITFVAAAAVWRTRDDGSASPVRVLDWRVPFLVFAAFYAFRHQRHTVLFGVAAAPLLIACVERLRLEVVERRPGLVPRGPVLGAALAGAAVVAFLQIGRYAWTLSQLGLSVHYGRLDFPANAIEFLRTHGISGNVALPFEWGSYGIWNLPSGSRVFIDGRFETVYPERVIDDYFAFMHGTEGWERLLEDYPTDVVIVQRWREIHPRLFRRNDLVYVYSDPAALVFLRRSPANRKVLDRLAMVSDRGAFRPPETVFP